MKLAKKTKLRGEKSMRPFRTFLLSFLAVLAFTLSAAAQQDQINTVVGGGPNDMPALDADVSNPYQVALDSSGNYYIASPNQNRVFKVNTSGFLTVVAGNGLPGYSGDGISGSAAQAMLNFPEGVAVDSSGNVYIADTNNQLIRRVDHTTNTITTVAGIQGSCTFDGDGTATAHSLCYPAQLAMDSVNNLLFIADSSNSRIRKLTVSTGAISTMAGGGTFYSYCANGTVATSCGFSYIGAVAVDSADDIFLSDTYEYVVYEVKASTGKITTIAGTAGSPGGTGDGGAATSATIYPYFNGQLAVNSGGTQVWLADFYNAAIRQIAVGGHINTVAGQNGVNSFSGDGGPATSAYLYYPIGVAVDSAGDLFIGDNNNDRIREVPCSLGGTCTPPTGDTSGDIYTVAGNGSTTYATPVSNVPALGVTLYNPTGVFEDPSNNIFLADTYNQMVRELVNSSGNVNIFAGNGTPGYNGDGISAPSAELYYPASVGRDSSGNIYIADQYNQIIRKVDTSGNISTFAGTPSSPGYSGDNGPAGSAQLQYPFDVFVDNYGNMFIADTYNHVIREVVCAVPGTLSCTPPSGETAGYIYTVAGNNMLGFGYSGDGGPATSAKLYYPSSASTDAAGNLYIADTSNQRIREVNASTQIINTVAGNGSCLFSGDGPATENSVCNPSGVRPDLNGNIFFTDTGNHRIRWVDGGGTLTTFAGNGTATFSGDGGPATSAELYFPNGLFEDPSGNFLICDSYNLRIRKINAFAAVGRSTGSVIFPIQALNTMSGAVDVTLSGIGPASITNISTSGDFTELDDCVGSLPNGTACTVSVYFTPTHSGARYGTLTVTTNGYFSTTTTVALQGTGEGLTITGAPLSFGTDPIGTPVVKSVTIKGNTTYSTIVLTGDTTDFKITSNTCTGMVPVSCAVGVTFNPTSTGAKKATLVIKDTDPTSPQLVGATGTGSSFESFTPTSVTFPTQLVNTTSKNTKITFKYTGASSLTMTSVTASAGFTVNLTGITSSQCNLSSTTVLAHNGLCYFNVAFAPGNSIGVVAGNATVNFTDPSDPNTSLQLPLSGTSTEVSLSPTTLAFGTVAAGTLNKSVTVTNKGTTTLTFSGTPTITGTGSGQFAVLPYGGGTISSCLNGTVMLTQNQSCTFTVQFTHMADSNSFTTTLNISDNGGASPQLVKMTAKD
jgi:NHL repeat